MNSYEPRSAQSGNVVLWLVVGLAVLVLGSWQFNRYKKAQRDRAQIEVQQKIDDQRGLERKELERRQAQEKAQADSLRTALTAIDSLVARWNDALKVADATGRIALAGPVANLQGIQREAAQITVPPCLDQAKPELLKAMDSTVQAFLVFMRNDANLGKVLASSHFEEAAKAMDDYKKGRAECPA